MSFEQIVAWCGGLVGVGSGVGTVVYNGLRARSETRKIDADAAAVLVSTAAGANRDLGDDLAGVRRELRQVTDRQTRHERLLIEHERWDHRLVEQLRTLGGEIADPPPLYVEGV